MKCAPAIILLFTACALFGQQKQEINIDSLFENDPCFNRPPAADLMEDNYWGNYNAMVEISVNDTMCYIVIDSLSNWNDKIYRSFDTIPVNQTILRIRNNCNKMWEYKQENNYFDMVLDDRDNWAFEYKIDDCYMSLQRYDVEEPLKNVIIDIMEIAGLKGYTVHRLKGRSLTVE